MLILESLLYFLVGSFVIGWCWGKYRINADSSSFYRTRRLSRNQEKTLIKGLRAARTYIKTN